METIVRNIDYGSRRVPWGGLGTDISHSGCIDEALFQAGLDWEVTQKPLQTVEEVPVPLTGYWANVRVQDNEPLGIVTDRYRVIQNSEAFGFVDSLIGEGVTFQQAGQFQNGRKVWVLAKLPDRYVLADEAVSPYVVFITSHDGSSSVKVAMTPVRVICCNMINLALRRASRTWSAQHTGDISLKLDDARDTLLHAGEYMDALGNEIGNLHLLKLTDSQVISLADKIYPEAPEMTDLQKRNAGMKRQDLLERYFLAPDLSILPRNAFRFIQAVSDHATHSDPARRGANYNENLFARSIEGNPLIDRAYALVKAV